MSRARLPILTLAWRGVGDMLSAARAAPSLFVFLLCLSALAAFVETAVPAALGVSAGMDLVIRLAVSAALTSVIAVALHRFVILSETNTAGTLAARSGVIADFAAVLFGAQYLSIAPMLIANSIWSSQDDMPVVVLILCIAVAIAGFVAILKYLFVLPAIAVESPERGLSANAIRLLSVALPIVLASALAMLLISLVGALVAAPFLLLAIEVSQYPAQLFTLVTQVAMAAATVAVVSRAYLWREGRWP